MYQAIGLNKWRDFRKFFSSSFFSKDFNFNFYHFYTFLGFINFLDGSTPMFAFFFFFLLLVITFVSWCKSQCSFYRNWITIWLSAHLRLLLLTRVLMGTSYALILISGRVYGTSWCFLVGRLSFVALVGCEIVSSHLWDYRYMHVYLQTHTL